MGVGSSFFSAKTSPIRKDGVDHIYDAYRLLKLEKKNDDEIYSILKKKYVKNRKPRVKRLSANIGDGKDSIRNFALQHFNQTLESNRYILEDDLSFGRRFKSTESVQSAPNGNLESYHSISKSFSPSTAHIRKTIRENKISEESPPDDVKPGWSRRPTNLTVAIDDDVTAANNLASGKSTSGFVNHSESFSPHDSSGTPRGFFHVGEFAINERGLRRMSSLKSGEIQTKHPFLTVGKSDFVEVGYLGSGVSGNVVEALHIPTLTIVALKMLHSTDSESISSELSILHENLAEIKLINDRLATENKDEGRGNVSLRSPCEQVLALYDAYLDSKSGIVNLVVEYMDGGSLQDLVDRGGCQDEIALADLSHQCLLGLDFLHNRNCIHRDIKPGNILINWAGIVKIADFGVAKAINMNYGKNADTAVVGTMRYMAPERMMSKSCETPSDIWSFGLTLLAVIMGRYPLLESHEQCDYWELIRVVCDEPIPSLNEDYSEELCVFVESCLQKKPEKRATVEELKKTMFIRNINSPEDTTSDGLKYHRSLSACSQPGQTNSVTLENPDCMLVKFAHLERILQKIQTKYECMMNVSDNILPENQDSQSFSFSSFRSASVKCQSDSLSLLPNFESGMEIWKYFASQLHLPVDIVVTTASSLVDDKYFKDV